MTRLPGVTDPGLLLVADVHALVGRDAEVREALADLADGSAGEPGLVSFRVLEAGAPGEFVLLGAWTDEAALRDHYRTSHYRRYRQRIGELLARPSDVVVHHVRETLHARDPNPPDPGLLG
jgi:quinol monooxygenase YgiN